MIGPFEGQYRWLSNFSPHGFSCGGYDYPTVEHFYQSAKCSNLNELWSIIRAATPGQAKRLGRSAAIRPEFELDKRTVMLQGVLFKFYQNWDVRQLLIATGTEHLEEVNTWGDTYWGTVNGQGENWLGRILMMVRETLA